MAQYMHTHVFMGTHYMCVGVGGEREREENGGEAEEKEEEEEEGRKRKRRKRRRKQEEEEEIDQDLVTSSAWFHFFLRKSIFLLFQQFGDSEV